MIPDLRPFHPSRSATWRHIEWEYIPVPQTYRHHRHRANPETRNRRTGPSRSTASTLPLRTAQTAAALKKTKKENTLCAHPPTLVLPGTSAMQKWVATWTELLQISSFWLVRSTDLLGRHGILSRRAAHTRCEAAGPSGTGVRLRASIIGRGWVHYHLSGITEEAAVLQTADMRATHTERTGYILQC